MWRKEEEDLFFENDYFSMFFLQEWDHFQTLNVWSQEFQIINKKCIKRQLVNRNNTLKNKSNISKQSDTFF